MKKMIIANRLDNGRVVFAAATGQWVESIDAGQLFDLNAEAQLTVAQADPLVIDPNLIEVNTDGKQRRPAAIREAIRAAGPTVEVETGTITE